jgi:hypothetical protein
MKKSSWFVSLIVLLASSAEARLGSVWELACRIDGYTSQTVQLNCPKDRKVTVPRNSVNPAQTLTNAAFFLLRVDTQEFDKIRANKTVTLQRAAFSKVSQ